MKSLLSDVLFLLRNHRSIRPEALEDEAFFQRYAWDDAHLLALKILMRDYEGKGWATSSAPRAERQRWNDWLAMRDAVWAQMRQEAPAWRFGVLDCRCGARQETVLIYAWQEPAPTQPGWLHVLRDHEESGRTFLTRPVRLQ